MKILLIAVFSLLLISNIALAGAVVEHAPLVQLLDGSYIQVVTVNNQTNGNEQLMTLVTNCYHQKDQDGYTLYERTDDRVAYPNGAKPSMVCDLVSMTNDAGGTLLKSLFSGVGSAVVYGGSFVGGMHLLQPTRINENNNQTNGQQQGQQSVTSSSSQSNSKTVTSDATIVDNEVKISQKKHR